MERGTPKFDGLAVGEFSASFLGASPILKAKAAFVNTQTKDTHGWTESSSWSLETMNHLRTLRASMESDLAATHFVGLDGGATEGAQSTQGPPRGFGEDLEEGADAPAI